MIVNNVFLSKIEVGKTETAQFAAEEGRSAGEAGGEAVSSHVPSKELKRFLGWLQQGLEVREERVQLVQNRLLAGFYLTPEAAARTAEAIQKADE